MYFLSNKNLTPQYPESILIIKYRPKLFVKLFKVEQFACQFSLNHSFAHLCGICRAQIKFEGFQQLELLLMAFVEIMWLKITKA
jgi:hypothetical protein